jgi:hypothetical protein
MKTIIKIIIIFPLVLLNLLATTYCYLIDKIRNGLGNYWLDKQAQKNQQLKQIITHSNKIKLILFTPNITCRFRASSFSTKEPETLEWMNNSEKKVFYLI